MKIAIATTFYEMDQQYSLVSVVRDRYELLTKHGHDVEVWVQEDFTGNDYGMNVVRIMSRFSFFDYQNNELKPEDIPNIEKVRLAISNRIKSDPPSCVFVEDLMFQGHFYVHNLAIREVAKEFPDIRWFAVAHSIPSGMKSIWSPLPLGSKVIALNENIAMHCAENYRTTIDNVHVIYNSMDFRTYTEKDPLSIDIYERYELMNADIIQIYPFSTERWIDKGVDKLLHIFSCLKQLGNNVKLVLVTAWQFPESVKEIRKKAQEFGLTESEAIITSEAYPNRVGMPNRVVRELMQISNLFVFPTRAEASPLILAESMMAGCYVVINDLLPQLLEIAGNSVRKFHLNSSVHHQHQNADENTFYLDVAKIIDAEMRINPIIKTKNKVRKEFCFEYLYRTQYAPLLNAPPSYEVTRLAHV